VADGAGPGAVVVGTSFGGRVHVPALRAAGFTVEALVGTNPEKTARRAERLGVPHPLTSVAEALELPGVEAVTIATPPAAHAPVAIQAARAGKHIICEKPFALDTAEAETMLDAVESAAVTHLVGHEFRWALDRALVYRAIQDGLIGEPRLATLVSLVPFVPDPEMRMQAWWFDESAGGGWLGASGSHIIDQLREWLGEFDQVSARLNVVSDRVDVAEDSFTVRFRTRSGVEGVLQQTAASWGMPPAVSAVAGTMGTVWTSGGATFVADRDGTRELPVPPDLELPPPPPPSDDPRERFSGVELGPYTRLCEVLRQGVDGRPLSAAVPIPTFADGVAAMRILDAIRASSANDGEIVRI